MNALRLKFLAPVTLISACAFVPPATHPDYSGPPVTSIVCSKHTVNETADRLLRAWRRCYVGPERNVGVGFIGWIPIPIPLFGLTTIHVLEERVNDQVPLRVQLPIGTEPLVAKIAASPSCNALVAVSGGPFLWTLAAKNTEAWITDPNSSGPLANCK
jgi:hypothetical protein